MKPSAIAKATLLFFVAGNAILALGDWGLLSPRAPGINITRPGETRQK